jgi:hypothetical protein
MRLLLFERMIDRRLGVWASGRLGDRTRAAGAAMRLPRPALKRSGQRVLRPAAVDDDFTGVSGGWYRAPGWRASEHASEGAARRKRLFRPKLTHSSWVSFKGGWY